MHRLVCLALIVVATAAHAESNPSELTAVAAPKRNQLRTDLAIGGPAGMIALRYSRELSSGLRIEPAIGLGYSGLLTSLLVTQPITSWVRRTKGGTPYATALELYGGYGASVLRDGLRHPWAASANRLPDGTYHWVDFGFSMTSQIRGLVIIMGSGASLLIKAPAALGAEMPEDDDFWFMFPEGWMRKQHWVPTLWSGIGYAF